MKLDEPLTFPAAAKEIGWKPNASGDYDAAGRRLLRRCVAKERTLPKPFIIRDSAGRPLKVTLADLHRFLPECVQSRVDVLAGTIRSLLEEVEQRAAEIVEERLQTTIEPELAQLRKANDELTKKLARLSETVEAYRAATAGPRRTTPDHSGQ